MNEIICKCGHTENTHTSLGCQVFMCDCVASLESLVIDGQAAEISRLSALLVEAGERENKIIGFLKVGYRPNCGCTSCKDVDVFLKEISK